MSTSPWNPMGVGPIDPIEIPSLYKQRQMREAKRCYMSESEHNKAIPSLHDREERSNKEHDEIAKTRIPGTNAKQELP